MPVPACFHLADHVFPRVRAEAARRLVASGWSQGRAAGALGVSQAMISKYQGRPVEEDVLVLRLTNELLDDLETPAPATGPSAWCTTLSAEQDRGDGSLEDLLEAERLLLAGDIRAIMPQVGLNLARALPDARSPQDVLAFPARIVLAGDHLVRPEPPVLGGSTHLAQCLLALRRRDPTLHAIANVRGGPLAVGLDCVELAGDGDRSDLFATAVRQASTTPTLVHDPGAVGIEPCLYVAGRSATDVAHTLLGLATVNP